MAVIVLTEVRGLAASILFWGGFAATVLASTQVLHAVARRHPEWFPTALLASGLGLSQADQRLVSRAVRRGERINNPRLARIVVQRAESNLRMRWLFVLLVAAETVVLIGAVSGRDVTARVAPSFAFLALGAYWLGRSRGSRRAAEVNRHALP